MNPKILCVVGLERIILVYGLVSGFWGSKFEFVMISSE